MADLKEHNLTRHFNILNEGSTNEKKAISREILDFFKNNDKYLTSKICELIMK